MVLFKARISQSSETCKTKKEDDERKEEENSEGELLL